MVPTRFHEDFTEPLEADTNDLALRLPGTLTRLPPSSNSNECTCPPLVLSTTHSSEESTELETDPETEPLLRQPTAYRAHDDAFHTAWDSLDSPSVSGANDETAREGTCAVHKGYLCLIGEADTKTKLGADCVCKVDCETVPNSQAGVKKRNAKGGQKTSPANGASVLVTGTEDRIIHSSSFQGTAQCRTMAVPKDSETASLQPMDTVLAFLQTPSPMEDLPASLYFGANPTQ